MSGHPVARSLPRSPAVLRAEGGEDAQLPAGGNGEERDVDGETLRSCVELARVDRQGRVAVVDDFDVELIVILGEEMRAVIRNQLDGQIERTAVLRLVYERRLHDGVNRLREL